MNAWKIVCATLVIFIAGIVTGVVLVRLGERGAKPGMRLQQDLANRPPIHQTGQVNPRGPGNPNRADAPPANSGNPRPGPMSRDFVLVLARELQLTPEQREQVTKLMSEGQERIRELRQGIDPEIRKEMQKTHEQIQAVLTPAQREEFLRLRLQRRNDAPNPPDRRGRDSRDRESREPRNPPPPRDDAHHPESPAP